MLGRNLKTSQGVWVPFYVDGCVLVNLYAEFTSFTSVFNCGWIWTSVFKPFAFLIIPSYLQIRSLPNVL